MLGGRACPGFEEGEGGGSQPARLGQMAHVPRAFQATLATPPLAVERAQLSMDEAGRWPLVRWPHRGTGQQGSTRRAPGPTPLRTSLDVLTGQEMGVWSAAS